jgi:UDP:flavonoid glycosyltransferase YjiC (YdhE family)
VRILFASTHGAGHFNPLVPFIDACLAAGHEVLVVGPPTLDPRGYPFRQGGSPPEEILQPLWQRIPSLPPAQAEVVVVGRIFARLNVEAMLPHIEAAIVDWRPDLVVRESNEYASAIAAERHGLPQVRAAIGLALTEQGALMLAAPELESTAPGIVERIAASRYVTCFPGSLDHAPFGVERYRDPAVDTPLHELPDWWPGDDSPLVYLSFGSVAAAFASAAEAYRAAVEQLGSLPVRVLLTLGRDLELGPVPANVHVEQWVPQGDVLDHADAVVCHGGSGTTLGALAYGVPLVVTPLFADQPYNAVAVALAGAGVVAAVDEIGAGLERVLADERFRSSAKGVADEMRRLPPAAEFLRG